MMTSFFSIIMGSGSLAQLSPCFRAFGAAKEAASRAFMIIDKKSEISIDDPRGIKPSKVEGDFEFKKVEFYYPLKQDKKDRLQFLHLQYYRARDLKYLP